MPYSNIPGTKAAYIDAGALSVNNRTGQPNILVIGPATSGDTLSRFNIAETSLAEAEFGSASPVMRAVHECIRQGADNISVIRAGGHAGKLTVTDSAGGTLTITTTFHDDDILDRYGLQVTVIDSVARYLVYDLVDRTYVYDSLNVLVEIDNGIVRVQDSNFAPGATLNASVVLPVSWTKLSAIATSSFDVSGASVTISTVEALAGDDGVNPSLVERYAALDQAYLMLDYKDADHLLPVDAYIDCKNIVDIADSVMSKSGAPASATDYGLFWSGPPAAGSDRDALGYLWRYIYRGASYVTFADQTDAYSFTRTAASYTGADALSITCTELGKGGNACTIEVQDDATGDATISFNSDGGVAIVVRADISGGATSADVAGFINTAVAAFDTSTISAFAKAPSELLGTATGDGTAAITVAANTNFTGGAGANIVHLQKNPHIARPAKVTSVYGNASDAQLREANFAHQLAEACYLGSTNWSTMLGAISYKEPEAGSIAISSTAEALADWAGDLPEYGDNGIEKYIGASGDNGEGALGNKFLAGAYGYRGHMLKAESASSGYAYGGFIRTVGSALPNGEKWPYGVNDADEAKDESGRVVDLGKHIHVTSAWPTHTNGFDGGSTYKGDLAAAFTGLLAVTPPAEEPIGVGSRLVGINGQNFHSTTLSDLAGIRAVGLRFDDTESVWIPTTAKTAAHPDSDYSRLSTIRIANLLISGCRQIAKGYIGKQFNPQVLLSLKSALDQFGLAQQAIGNAGKVKIALNYTRSERILGRLNIQVRFVPPFSIESVVVKTSVAADESDI